MRARDLLAPGTIRLSPDLFRILRKFQSRSFSDDEETRVAAIAAFGLSIALSASACAGGGGNGGSSSNGQVTLTFWINATAGPGLT